MKKNLVLFVLVLSLIIPGISMAGKEEIVIKIDGVILNTGNVSPYIKNGTTFVPLKAISEALNYEVLWDPVNKIVTMKKGHTTVNIPVGKNRVNVNGKDRNILQPANIIEGTTYVPIRFVSELIGYEVQFRKEEGVSIINIISPPVEISIDKNKADKFVNDYINNKGYKLIQYIMADVTGDSVQDYIILVDMDKGFESHIILIDGKTENELAQTVVMKGYEDYSLEAKRITGENKRQIYYFANDGYIYEYIFDYSSGVLKDIYKDIRDLQNLGDDHFFAYFIDYPSLNKVICMKPTEKIVNHILVNNSFKNEKERKDAFGYDTYIDNMDTPGELKISYELKVFPIGNDTKAILYHTYNWNNGKWDIKSAKMQGVSTNEYKIIESKYNNSKEYSTWCKDGVLNITKNNVDKIFSSSEKEITIICGKPNNISNLPYSTDINHYNYNGYTVKYEGGNNKHSWGPSQINFNGGNSKALGIKVGTNFKDIKKTLGKPVDEGISEGDGLYFMNYRVSGYDFYFIGTNGNGTIHQIQVKEAPVL